MLFIVCCFCYAFVTFINVVFVFFVDVFAVSVTVATYKFIFLNCVGFVLFCFVFSILAVPFFITISFNLLHCFPRFMSPAFSRSPSVR